MIKHSLLHTAPAAALAIALTLLPARSAGETAAENAAAGDSPVATVDGQPILQSELDRMISMQTGGEGLSAFPEEARAEIRRQILDLMIANVLVSSAAEKAKTEVPAADVDKFIAEVEGQAGGKDQLAAGLAANGVSMDKFRADVARSIRQERWAEEQLKSRVAISDKDVEDFYNTNPAASQMPEMVRASHILLTFDPSDPASQDARLKEITALREQITGGADFAEIARRHSQDPGSKDGGGDLNYFARGRMVKEFEDAAFSLDVGKVSEPVKTQYGYHLIKVTDRKAARQVPLDEAKDRIRMYLENRKREEAMRQIIDDLRSKADVKILL